ncbi:hypothetical protein ACBY01_15620 [Sphingomonas sp. ac-8]|uniref:hypothetical protein n=1 Tax=Sphingomonas sp. ac-8 TaxID=3242977 RepID=UPI003A809C92
MQPAIAATAMMGMTTGIFITMLALLRVPTHRLFAALSSNDKAAPVSAANFLIDELFGYRADFPMR